MHPAKSVIFFTTASGAGYGLLVLFALLDLAGKLPIAPTVTLWGLGAAAALIVGGLLSSTFHLGRPERAWRALSQWRTSWLSREGVLAILTFPPFAAYAYGRYALPEGIAPWQPLAAAGSAGLALLTVYCTAMIYASLRPVPAWANPWTPVCYLALSLSTGAILLHALSVAFGFASVFLTNLTAVLILIGMVVKMMYWRSAGNAAPVSTAESATGLGDMGKVSLFEAPHDADNYLMKEMVFRVARKHARRLRRVAIIWGFLFPLLAVTLSGFTEGLNSQLMVALSVLTGVVGIGAERWLFFAEAKHAVSLYYGESRV
jgi:DMSO reductase anchor subunit